jgi:hypothetical protein
METTLKCPHCEATTLKNGQPFTKLSSLNAHINIHCDKNPNSKLIKGSGSGAPAPAGHSHKFSLLKPISLPYANAMNAGYTKICHDCGELA